jgi:hypothetical protein
MRYRNRKLAAEYLTAQGVSTTEQGLADKAKRGQGPKYAILNGRACYTDVDLEAWLTEQAARPVMRRKSQPLDAA